MLLRFPSQVAVLAALGVALGALRCSSDDAARGNDSTGAGGSGGDNSRGTFDLDLDGGGTGGGPGAGLHPLCQTTGHCLPEDRYGCEPVGTAGSTGEGGMGGQTGVGDAGGPGSHPPGSSGGGYSGDEVPACHLVEQDGAVVRACQPGGEGELDAPCLSPANCAPGFTCVGSGASGLCRPYCCQGDQASCSEGTYCAARQVVGSSQDLEAPVCVRADQCKLSEEYPCPEGASCQCPADTACVPVRADGTTSCVTAGAGEKGDACEGPFSCSYGHVCSHSRGCLELCSTVSTRGQCTEGEFCQALSGFPNDVGVCIALTETR